MYESIKLTATPLASALPMNIAINMLSGGRTLHKTGNRVLCDPCTGFVILNHGLSYMDLCAEVGLRMEVVISDKAMIFFVGDQALGIQMGDAFEIITLGDENDGLTKIIAILKDEDVQTSLRAKVEDDEFFKALHKYMDDRILALANEQ